MKKAGLLFGLIAVCVIGYFVYLSDSSSGSEPVPVITVMDILHASDLEQGIKSAVKQNDTEALQSWLEKARDVAEQAGLSDTDLNYLASQQAVDYVKFNAKRSLFNDEFEARYYALDDIDDVKARYPEAKDLFPQVDALIEKRDQIIEQIAVTLASGKSPNKAERDAAKTMWQQRYRQTNDDTGSDSQPGHE